MIFRHIFYIHASILCFRSSIFMLQRVTVIAGGCWNTLNEITSHKENWSEAFKYQFPINLDFSFFFCFFLWLQFLFRDICSQKRSVQVTFHSTFIFIKYHINAPNNPNVLHYFQHNNQILFKTFNSKENLEYLVTSRCSCFFTCTGKIFWRKKLLSTDVLPFVIYRPLGK